MEYRSIVETDRAAVNWVGLPDVPLHELPGETVQYLMVSRYCPSDQFQTFVEAEFGSLSGGAQVMGMCDWIQRHFSYVPGVSTSETTARETFVRREGVGRDYAHMLITLVRAAGHSVAHGERLCIRVNPQDFHAVAEVFLGGEWHLVDATGMASPSGIAKIGVGRLC